MSNIGPRRVRVWTSERDEATAELDRPGNKGEDFLLQVGGVFINTLYCLTHDDFCADVLEKGEKGIMKSTDDIYWLEESHTHQSMYATGFVWQDQWERVRQ